VLSHTLLGRTPSIELIESIADVAIELRYPGAKLERYSANLKLALSAEPPPFGTPEYGDVYRHLSVEPRWMAVSLVTNAEREGDGSRRLWSLAACASDKRHRRLLKKHACDESRHARMYLALLQLSFPGSVSPEFAEELRQLSPGFALHQDLYPIPGSPYAKNPTIDDFLQMNIAEIRTMVHHTMQRPVLSRHCPPEHQDKITQLLDRLLEDELSHIAYTAVLVDELGAVVDGERLAELFVKRLRDFNLITNQELGGNVFDCSVACCAKRPTCRAKVSDSAGPVYQVMPPPMVSRER